MIAPRPGTVDPPFRTGENRLLNGLSRHRRNRLRGQLEPIVLSFGDVLAECDQPIRHVYFPISGYIAVIGKADDHSTLELGMIGDEGMLGISLLLGVRQSPLKALVQGAGCALRMTTADFERELSANAKLDRELKRYLHLLLGNLARGSLCVRFHRVAARLARYLLSVQDCAHANHFHLKHELLGEMLGVRRSGITVAAGSLQRQKLIHYHRGHITVLDRAGLERVACECYARGAKARQKVMG